MLKAQVRVILAAAAFLLGAACGERFEAGLANAPSLDRQTRPRRPHDVISNGQESCPQSAASADPLWNRVPPCEESEPDGSAPRRDGGGGGS